MQHTTIEEIAFRINSEFKLDLDEYFVRQHALNAVNEMGLISTEDVLIRGTIKDYCLKLPLNIGALTRINWVIAANVRASTTVSIAIQNIWFPPQIIFVPIPNADMDIAVLETDAPVNVIPKIRGPYIPYKWKCPVLKFNETDIDVIVYAERLEVDKDTKLPSIPRECLEACAFYCAEVYYRPLFMLGKVPPYVWEKLERWTDKAFARGQNQLGFKQLNQNQMNDIMNVMSSWDRKAYGVDS
jgi:hypothetical protein